jgi:citrate synthase
MNARASESGRSGGSDYLSSAQALAILAVKPQTLYSYVSRGLVRRICLDRKTSLYSRADIDRLKARSTARSGHGPAAGAALHWGEPVLVTGITEITEEGPRYREHLAADLAKAGFSYESVAEYLWSTEAIEPDVCWDFDDAIHRIGPRISALIAAYPRIHLHQLLSEIVLLLAIEQGEAPHGTILKTARALVQGLTLAFGFAGPLKSFVAPKKNERIASYVLRSLGHEPRPQEVRVLNSVLVLLADHEFSTTTFAARIAASSQVDLCSCIGAALHVQFGSALGFRCDRIEDALRNGVSAAELTSLEYSQPVYKQGDPRARLIIELITTLGGDKAPGRELLAALGVDLNARRGPSLDAALVVLSRSFGLTGLGTGLLAISRSAGWIAHVLEQYRQDFVIRPRAKFVPDEPAFEKSGTDLLLDRKALASRRVG